jgi:hypothetical protein
MCSDGTTTDAQKLANLETLLRACFGADLIGLWIGEDAIWNGSNELTSWPCRVGTALANGTAVLPTKGDLNGRVAILGPAGTAYLDATLAAPVASIMLVVTASPRGVSFCVYADSPRNDGSIQENTQAAFPSGLYVAGGWAHVVDRVPSEVITAGPHIIEGHTATTLSTQFRIGTNAGAFLNRSPTACALALSAAPSTDQLNAADAVLREYYDLAA